MTRIPILVILIFTACSSPSKNDEQAYQFKLQPLPNSQYTYTLENTMTSKQEVQGNEQSNDQSINIQFTTAFSSTNSNQHNVNFTYNKFIYSTNINGNKRTVDASTAANSTAPEDKMFAAFHNARLSAVIDNKGKLVTVSGNKELVDKMMSYLPNDPVGRSSVESAIRDNLGESFIKNTLQQCFMPLPDSALRPGNTWKKTDTITSGVELIINSTYKLESVTNNIADISINSIISSTKTPTLINTTQIESELSGNQEGNIKIDVPTGLVIESASTLNASGKLKMVGLEIPLTIKNKSNLRGRKL